MSTVSALILAFALLAPVAAAADDIASHRLKAIEGRTYVLYVPPDPRPGERFPLLVTLHGSGRDAASVVDKWRPLARKERVVVAGPDAVDRRGWQMLIDGPDALYFLVQEVSSRAPIDPRRIYVFGHSAGAVFGLSMGLLQSEYFAAVAVHAGALQEANADALLKSAARKIPVHIQIGTKDSFFPLPRVRATRDRLQAAGFPVTLAEIANHEHWYYDRAAFLNQQAWTFLSGFQLTGDPKYVPYVAR